MACSEKEGALREILGATRVDAALGRSDEQLSALFTSKEVFLLAERGLGALSLDTYLLTRGERRSAAKEAARAAVSALPDDALDLLIVAVCARHRLGRKA